MKTGTVSKYAKRTLLLLVLLGFCMGAYAATSGSITLSGAEQFNSSNSMWDSGFVTVSLNGYVKTIPYGQFSTPDSIASAIAALYTSDCNGPANARSAPGGIVYFQMRDGQTLSQLTVTTNSSISFAATANNNLIQTGTTATIASTQLLQGQTTTVSVQVSCDSACGSVDYRIDGGEWGTVALNANGQFSAGTGSNWSPGLHNVVIYYQGNGNYAMSTSNPVSFVISSSTSSNPTSIYSYNISSYDLDSNVETYSDSVNGNWSNIAYDGANRLTSAIQVINGTTQYMCWSYDSFGNRTAQGTSASPCSSPSPTVAYNANNQSTGLTYDPSGDVTSGDGNQFLYDAEGRVCAVQYPVTTGITAMVQYLYDAEGRRVAKGTISSWSCDITTNGYTETNGYVLGPDGEQVTEVDGQGNWIHTNVFANGDLIATYNPQGLHFHLSDWLGSRRIQMDYLGNPESNFQNLPFGELVPQNQSLAATEQQFTGKERDQESGLNYFGARYYDSTMGRFMSPDPIAISPELANPQSWNKYSYTFNNPLKMVDPDGQWPFYIHNAIIEASFSGVLSSRQIGLIEHESYLMDFAKGQQYPANANEHGMCVPRQSVAACNAGVANFIDGVFSKASAASGDDRIELFADMGHTVMDLGSPEHVDSNGVGITWTGGLLQDIPHFLGESTIDGNFLGIGKSIRYLIELYTLLNPDEAKRQGGTTAWEDRAINNFVDMYMSLGVQSQRQGVKNAQGNGWEDRMRQCALGNPAACDDRSTSFPSPDF